MEIVLGVGGGIAAYKAALLLRLMTEAGHGVTVVPTANALEFVGTATKKGVRNSGATGSKCCSGWSTRAIRGW